jgi:hypothetical protein
MIRFTDSAAVAAGAGMELLSRALPVRETVLPDAGLRDVLAARRERFARLYGA